MTENIKSIGIIKESRSDESRSPIAPQQISLIKEKFPSLEVLVQPCNKRSFANEEYESHGAILSNNPPIPPTCGVAILVPLIAM